jgi:hypothetical protein
MVFSLQTFMQLAQKIQDVILSPFLLVNSLFSEMTQDLFSVGAQKLWSKTSVIYQQLIIFNSTFSKEINNQDNSMETGQTLLGNWLKNSGESPNSLPTALAPPNDFAGTNITIYRTRRWIPINNVTTVIPLEVLIIPFALAQLPSSCNIVWLSTLPWTMQF